MFAVILTLSTQILFLELFEYAEFSLVCMLFFLIELKKLNWSVLIVYWITYLFKNHFSLGT